MELASSVGVDVESHWSNKVRAGIVPTEVSQNGGADPEKHAEEMNRLAEFETHAVGSLFQGDPIDAAAHQLELHYFGIGTGQAFKKVVTTANSSGYIVVGYDAALASCANGKRVLHEVEIQKENHGLENLVFQADIEFACQPPYIDPRHARKLVVPRVLDVTDKQDPDWTHRAKRQRKLPRTARRIGKLLHFLEDILIIHPCANDNPKAIWGDTTPYTLISVVEYVKEGFKGELKWKSLGTVDFHGHIYTAILIQKG